ncbi:MAG: UDP-N-acetylmuramoyl-L-alanyl-D-glutamate--2,6-diaminopimelate ligase [Sumerlaeia bacterium]
MTPPPSPLTPPQSLRRLLTEANLMVEDLTGDADVPVTDLTHRAQQTQRGGLFIAIKGHSADGHLMISDAVQRGARSIVTERAIPPYPGVTVVQVKDTRQALGRLAQAFHGHPSRGMTIAGVTGTNGKSTVVGLIHTIWESAGLKAGRAGTLGTAWGEKDFDHGTTTPDALFLAQSMAAMAAEGVTHLAMEVSSHAIDQARVAGVPMHAGVFTNISQDHLDYHGDFPTYIGVKRRLFFDYVEPSGGVSVLNIEDPVGEELAFSLPGRRMTFSHRDNNSAADLRAENVFMSPGGTRFTLHRRLPNGKVETAQVATSLIGEFNVSNMLAAAGACLGLGMELPRIAKGLSQARCVAGRFEQVHEGQPFSVIVDYAHTPDALEKVLRTARRITAGRLITVFGCGGDRDRSKRPLMGRTAARYSDYVILTSDNPRTEDPEEIARQALAGLQAEAERPGRYQVVLDRANAIERAIQLAQPGDCVMIAGKGHETYQQIGTTRHPFDDRQAARDILQSLADSWRTAPRSSWRPEEATG